MKKVNVLLVSPISLADDFEEKIAAVDPRISVKNAAMPFVNELRGQGKKGQFIDLLEESAKRSEALHPSRPKESLETLLAEAEAMFGVVLLPDNLVSRSPNLKWMHIGGTGIDTYNASGIFDGRITVTNSRGTQAIPIAEYVIGYMFMMAKNARRLFENQKNRKWDPFLSLELREKTVGIIGLGAIGMEIARLAKGLGMRVIATRRSATRKESNVFGIDELYPTSSLHQMLSQCDYVVAAVPTTPETQKIIGEKELRAMKPTAFFINIGRGETVNQLVLTKALKENWIAGAGLDVYEKEPLPTDSELWGLPNVILSSHGSGATSRRSERVLDLFLENLRRYVHGEQLLNIIDIKKGY
jgi:phosphoglycerate dehydrogenase-like enzyme